MFTRQLTKKEREFIYNVEEFIRDKHHACEGHDYSHVLQVLNYALDIAHNIEDEVDPFILTCGALFHDIGRTQNDERALHGITGGNITDTFLKSTWVNEDDNHRIVRIVVRHTVTSHIPPETTEEKIVYDADGLDRLGIIGMVRGLMSKKGSIKEVLENRSKKRINDYKKLYFNYSRQLGESMYRETVDLVYIFLSSLEERMKEINDIDLP